MIDYYTDIKPRVDLAIEHFKKPCLKGKCVESNGMILRRCERHKDTAAIVRRYLRLLKHKENALELRVEQSFGTYYHADRCEWRKRFPI